MNAEQLKQLKALSQSFQAGKADVNTIRQLSKIIEKIQTESKLELRFYYPHRDNFRDDALTR